MALKILKVLCTLAIYGVAFLGDYIVFKSKLSEIVAFRAVSDSVVHATIGFLSAVSFFSNSLGVSLVSCAFNVILCTLVSAIIDIDHAVLARSFNFKDLTSLRQRGFFHCTTLWLMVTMAMLKYSQVEKMVNLYLVTWMLIIAFSSHHIRDANRRGIWLYPFGHTQPVNKFLYTTLVALQPHIFAISYIYLKPDFSSGKNFIMVA